MYQDKINRKATVAKIDKDNYAIISTGEVKKYNHSKTRKNNYSEVKRSLQRLRDYINANVTELEKCRFITLTYAENMRDTERLRKDLERFVRKCRKIYGHFEYITACEPQGRGAWHAHAIFIFNDIAPYMDNKEVYKLWDNKGWVKIKAMYSDNMGAYYSAYLADMEFTIESTSNPEIDLKHCEIKEVNGKKYIKGARLYLYPTGFNLYRTSKGIKKPIVEEMEYIKAKEKVTGDTMTYEKNIMLEDGEFKKHIRYEYYNTVREE